MTKANKGQFLPGQSGNPGGRPKNVAEVIELARTRSVEAIEILTTIARNTKAPAQARVAAANSLLDRGFGKPSQSVAIGQLRENFDEMTDEELRAIAARED